MANRPAPEIEREDRRRRAAESVWNWKSAQQSPAARATRRFSATVLRDFAIGLVVAAVLYAAGRPVIAGAAAAISVLVLTVRAILPLELSEPVVALAGRAARHAGHALTAVVLGAVYFTVFVLLRAWRSLTGHDSLRLKRGRAGGSYWIDRSTLPGTSPDKPY
jgi:hypothetical protein